MLLTSENGLAALSRTNCLVNLPPSFFPLVGGLFSFQYTSARRYETPAHAFLDRVVGPLDRPDETAPLLLSGESSNTSATLSASGIWKSFIAINASFPVFLLGRPFWPAFL